MQREQRGKWVRLPVEVRANEDGILTVEGYASVFNEETNIGGLFRERIAPGAFTDAIKRDDVVFLINHDGLPLARSRGGEGTLELIEDDHGLHMRTELDPSDPDVRSIAGKMRRGDLDKMSFAFLPSDEDWDDSGDLPLRTVRSASLFDVSIVTSPAYEGTEIGLRSLNDFRRVSARKNFNAMRLRQALEINLAQRENGVV